MNRGGSTISEGYVDNIIQSMNDSLIVTDNERIIRTVHRATTGLLGYSENELVGQPVEKIIDDVSELSVEELLQSRDNAKTNIETVYLNSEGDRIPVNLSHAVLWDRDNITRGFVYVAQDISVRRIIEESIRASEEYARSFMESSQDCITDILTNGEISNINPAGCTLNELGSPEEVIGKHCTFNIIENKEAVGDAVKKAAQGENVERYYESTEYGESQTV